MENKKVMDRFTAHQAYQATLDAQIERHGSPLKVLPLPGSRFYESADVGVRDPIQEVEEAVRQLKILATAE
jgi:hypothetical protein